MPVRVPPWTDRRRRLDRRERGDGRRPLDVADGGD
jgi:hypothetical protein